jgi:hypothetical protein
MGNCRAKPRTNAKAGANAEEEPEKRRKIVEPAKIPPNSRTCTLACGKAPKAGRVF